MSYDSHRSFDGKIPEGDDPLEFIKAHPPMNAHQMRADCEWLIAEVERLRDPVIDWMQIAISREAERDAALAAIDRFTHTVDELRAWRACADQLAARLQVETRHAALAEATDEALTAYEQLKATS